MLAAAVVGLALLPTACTSSKHQSGATSPLPTPSQAATAQSSAAPATNPTSNPPTSGGKSGQGGQSGQPAAVWPTYHRDAARTGAAADAKPVTKLAVAATAKLDAAIYASPLVLRDAKGPLIIAATENNTLYALRNDGSVVWQRHIGTPVDGGSLPCGNIDPTGITGTPAYDASSGLIFAVAFLTGHHHELVAVDARTGNVAWTKPVDPPGAHPEAEQQRSALLVSSNRVWVASGGWVGDCGPSRG
jgi:hypothetical protein